MTKLGYVRFGLDCLCSAIFIGTIVFSSAQKDRPVEVPTEEQKRVSEERWNFVLQCAAYQSAKAPQYYHADIAECTKAWDNNHK